MRWRLLQPHYLSVPGTEWEYKETDRTSGKQGRKVFSVPAYLNPEDPADQNYPGEIVVCHEGKGQLRDIVFVGPPTPDMEPLDEEAQALSASESVKWQHPIESLPGNYSASILSDLERQIDALAKGQAAQAANPVSTKGIDSDAFAKMQEQLAWLTEQNALLMERLMAQEAEVTDEPSKVARRA